MNEDERYRTSSQYRLWSYSPESLASLRETTNELAATRVREAISRSKANSTAPSSADTSEAETKGGLQKRLTQGSAEVECLTAEEELKLLTFYCGQTIEFGNHLKVPTEVKASAVQYMKRFYITNSLMTYHPKDILKTALFFATKTENHYIPLASFAATLPKTKTEDILASEFLLTQGLRFTFDIRHPYRALEGAIMDLQALASGDVPALPGRPAPEPLGSRKDMTNRVREAHGKARDYLKTSAVLTDSYFHYTPSQIMLASLLIADPDLTDWYMRAKLPSSGNSSAEETLRDKVMMTLEDCSNMLKTIHPSSKPTDDEISALKALNKKLQKCRNPDKIDLVAINKVAKREGGEEGLDEKTAKKRKLEQEKLKKEGHDLFGPDIKTEGHGLFGPEIKKEGHDLFGP